MNKLFKILASTLLILSINIHAVFTGAKLIRNKKTGCIVSFWDDYHPEFSALQEIALMHRDELFSFIEGSKAAGQNIFVAVEDYPSSWVQDQNKDWMAKYYPETIMTIEKARENISSLREAVVNKNLNFQAATLALVALECRLKNIPHRNCDRRELFWNIVRLDRLGLLFSRRELFNFKALQALKTVERIQHIQKLNIYTITAKMRSLLIEHIYQSQPEFNRSLAEAMCAFEHPIMNLMLSCAFQVDLECILTVLEQVNRDHIFVMAGYRHTEVIYKLLLESGEYEPIATFGAQGLNMMDDPDAPILDIKQTIVEIQQIITSGKKAQAPAIRAKL